MLASGQLKKRIELQEPTNADDGLGGSTVTWTTKITVWAAIWDVQANERIQAMQRTATTSHQVRIRYDPDIKTSWRIKWGTKYFSIDGIINPNMANEYLDLLCKETS